MPGRIVIQWDKEDCADLGIIKVDLLGLGKAPGISELPALLQQGPNGIRTRLGWVRLGWVKSLGGAGFYRPRGRRLLLRCLRLAEIGEKLCKIAIVGIIPATERTTAAEGIATASVVASFVGALPFSPAQFIARETAGCGSQTASGPGIHTPALIGRRAVTLV